MFPRSLKDQKCCSCIALHRVLRAEHDEDEPQKMVCRAKASRATVKCSVCKSVLTAVPSEILGERLKKRKKKRRDVWVHNQFTLWKPLQQLQKCLLFFPPFCFTYFLKTTEWDIAIKKKIMSNSISFLISSSSFFHLTWQLVLRFNCSALYVTLLYSQFTFFIDLNWRKHKCASP